MLSCLPIGALAGTLVGRRAVCRPAGSSPPSEDAALFRVFLKDGSSLVSYGELARVDDRVVFSMPTSASPRTPQLHLVTISADRVDWDRTTRYAESARATRYIGTRAEADYAQLTDTTSRRR